MIDIRQQAVADHRIDRLEGEVGVDGAAAVADQQREMVDFSRLGRFQHHADARAQSFPNEVMVQAGDRQQGRHRRIILVHAAVAEDDQIDLLLLDHAARHHAQFLQGFGEALLAAGQPEENRQHPNLETRQIEAAQLGELLVGEDRPFQLHPAAGGGLRVEEVAFRAEAGFRRDDQLLADAVDRRVGHLGEELLEIIVEQPRLVGENRKGRIVAHRADGFHAVARHRGE